MLRPTTELIVDRACSSVNSVHAAVQCAYNTVSRCPCPILSYYSESRLYIDAE